MSIASPLEQAMLKLINAERAAVGVAPLSFDTNLNDAAEDHSSSMLVNNIFSHTGADGSSARERMVEAGFRFEGTNASGENIAFQSERGAEGLADDVEDLHDSLMDSPGHRANILSANFDEIGIGIVEGSYTAEGGTFNAVMVTQNFAKTDAVDLPTVVVPEVPEIVVTPEEPEIVVITDEPEMPVVTVEVDDPKDDPNPQDDPKDDPKSEDPIPLPKPPHRPKTDIEEDEGDDETVVLPKENPTVEGDDDETVAVTPIETREEPTDIEPEEMPEDKLEDEPQDKPAETDEETPEDPDDQTDEETPDTEFVFQDDEETPGDTETPTDTGYVWTKTHDDETYAKVITDFTANCDATAFASLDQELQAFVLREFDCNFDIA